MPSGAMGRGSHDEVAEVVSVHVAGGLHTETTSTGEVIAAEMVCSARPDEGVFGANGQRKNTRKVMKFAIMWHTQGMNSEPPS